MAITASARRVAGLRHEVDVNGRHTLVTDEPESLGGTDAAPTPHELLPAAVAACVSTMVSLYAQRKGWALGEVGADVVYDPDAVPRTFDVTLHLPPGLSPEQVTRLKRVADTCPVRRALESQVAFTEHLDAPGLAA